MSEKGVTGLQRYERRADSSVPADKKSNEKEKHRVFFPGFDRITSIRRENFVYFTPETLRHSSFFLQDGE
jgi:hypothetical protein